MPRMKIGGKDFYSNERNKCSYCSRTSSSANWLGVYKALNFDTTTGSLWCDSSDVLFILPLFLYP